MEFYMNIGGGGGKIFGKIKENFENISGKF